MRALVLLPAALALACPAAAQESWGPQPVYDDRGLVVAYPAHEREAGGFSFAARGAYLGSLHPGGGDFAGAELAVGGWLWLEGPLALVLRGRAASYLTLQSPAGELDDTSCGTSGFYLSFCSGDADWLALAAGGELGLRLEHREWIGSVAVAVGGELSASGTGYLATFEHAREGGSLGGAGLLFVDWLVRDRWGVGLEVGARIEAGLGSPDRAALHGGVRFTLRP